MEIFGSLQSMGIEAGTGLLFVMLLALLVTGIPLAFVTLLVTLIFALGWFGPNVVPLITSRVYSFVSSFVFVSVPMFVLMAAILDRSGIARDLFDAMRLIGGRIRGGVAVQTIFVAVILAAMSGIIGGEIVLLGLIALPQMLRQGYDRRLAIGVVCAGGSLGTMVPPSIVLIIYGLTANVSIGELFTAAFIPGFMLALFYVSYVLARAYLTPGAVPDPVREPVPLAEKLRLLKGLFLPIVVVIMVLGSIYGGITGITEAAGMGAISVLILSILRGEASFDLVWDSLMRTLKSTGTIIWVTIGAAALAGAYTIAGGPTFVANLIIGADLPTMGILLVMMLILLFMGAFMDWVGIVLLIIPVFLPIVQRLPIEEIGLLGTLQPKYLAVWFGVLFCMNMQVSFLSPPFGPAAFYLKSVAPPHIQLTDIFKGFLPFIGIQLLALAVLLIWPPIIEILLE